MVDGLGFVLGEQCTRIAQVCRRSEGWGMSEAGVVKKDFLEEVA